MYRLDNSFAQYAFTVAVVGCGGTGGFVAEGLCRLLPSRAKIVLVDHDWVEGRNLRRQNFAREDLGLFKSEALAKRLARRYERPIAYSILPAALIEIKGPGIVIGCVDNGLARLKIARRLEGHFSPWWVDAGNGNNYGQVLIGRSTYAYDVDFDLEKEVCYTLPLPTIQRPELLAQRQREPSCAEAAEQGPTINQAMAALAVEVVHRLIEGTCPWMQLYLNLEEGTLYPVLATPETVERLTGIKTKRRR